ncbi:hypothetical protein BC831DRAFT_474667 [Entophlyctis helioformis]|nr:hypothetical protein BC831DRAFT_474667 [Entophlyctis helioformis]
MPTDTDDVRAALHAHIRATNEALVRLAALASQPSVDLATSSLGKAQARAEMLALVDAIESHVHRLRDFTDSATTLGTPQAAQGLSSSAPVSSSAAPPLQHQPPIPMLALSPLTRKLAVHTQSLVDARSRYQAAVAPDQPADAEPVPLAAIRRLLEDVQIAQARLADVQTVIDRYAATPITMFQPASLAAHIAFVSVRLFASISIPSELGHLPSLGRVGDCTKHCLDWHEYLRSIATTAVLTTDVNSVFGPPPPNAKDLPTAAHAHAAALETLVSTALHLTYVYRDLEAATAILAALASQPIARLSRSWSFVQPTTLAVFAHLSHMLGIGTPDHHHCVLDVLSGMVLHHGTGGQPLHSDPSSSNATLSAVPVLLAVPSMRAIVSSIIDIYDAYTVSTDPSTGHATLSDYGAQSLQGIIGLVKACQSNAPYSGPDQSGHLDGDGAMSPSAAPRIASPLSPTHQERKTAAPMPKLDQPLPVPPKSLWTLQAPNDALTHWLLTRVYHGDVELWHKSMELMDSRGGPGDHGARMDEAENAFWLSVTEARQQHRQRHPTLVSHPVYIAEPISTLAANSVATGLTLSGSDLDGVLNHLDQQQQQPASGSGSGDGSVLAPDLLARFNQLKHQ